MRHPPVDEVLGLQRPGAWLMPPPSISRFVTEAYPRLRRPGLNRHRGAMGGAATRGGAPLAATECRAAGATIGPRKKSVRAPRTRARSSAGQEPEREAEEAEGLSHPTRSRRPRI